MAFLVGLSVATGDEIDAESQGSVGNKGIILYRLETPLYRLELT